jgi:DNA-binding transcriptional regulator YiaG
MHVTYTRGPKRMVVPDLVELRQSLGLTQREAALLLEVTVNTWGPLGTQ